MQVAYQCPDCRTDSNIHSVDCRFADVAHTVIASAYMDILATLVGRRITRPKLVSEVGDWESLHGAILATLSESGPVVTETVSDKTVYTLQPADVFRESNLHPHYPPISTVYEHGSVPGCHDHALFAMVAWYEMQDVSWEETLEYVVDWLHESGTWERGGFEERTPEAAVQNKRHVWNEGYGWKRAAQEVVSTLESSSTVSV